MIKTALISVSDKSGLDALAKELIASDVKIISSGGTFKYLKSIGCEVQEVSDYTGHPEMMNGRVKTLHPKIHAGILANRDVHLEELESMGYPPIDLVVVNLYPFINTVQGGATFEEAIENIDIGGPTMIRAAAKNFKDVLVLSDPSQYEDFLLKLKNNSVDLDFRKLCAARVFENMAQYDGAISNYLNSSSDVQLLNSDGLSPATKLRYGENPHQEALLYKFNSMESLQIANCDIIQGKPLSYNNMVDADAAWECVKEFDGPSCVIVKHANPCGVGSSDNIHEAYLKAFQTDPTSAFGGVIAVNDQLTQQVAKTIIENQFLEIIVATDYEDGALEAFESKPNVRVLKASLKKEDPYPGTLKKISGGILWQSNDDGILKKQEIKVVTKRVPTEDELNDLLFAWKVAKFVKSNAIVFAKDDQTIGIGAGQMSRVISTEIAALKADQENLDAKNSAMASDAFFPFRDGIDQAAKVGITSIIQPGGSMRDDEVIEAANEHNLAMVFTGMRHFRH